MKRLIVAALLIGAVGPALGQDQTGAKIERAVAEVFAPKLKEAKLTAVALDPITWAKTGNPASAGAGLAQSLADCLTKHGIGLTAKVPGVPVLGGTLARVTDEESVPPAPALKLVLVLSLNDKPVAEVPLLILMEGFIRVCPVDVTYPPKATSAEKVEVLKKALDALPPPPPPPGEKVKWNKDKTVGLSLLAAARVDVDAARTAATADLEKGRPEGSKVQSDEQLAAQEARVAPLFMPRELDAKHRAKTAVGELCRFRVVNKNPFAIAGEFRVAGVDWCEFADDAGKGKPALLVVVPATSEVVVRGWYLNDRSSLTFEVQKLPDTAATKKTDVGVVSLSYRACWKKGDNPPAGDEDFKLSDQVIGQGGIQGDKFERVERLVGKDRGTVKLDYGNFKE